MRWNSFPRSLAFAVVAAAGSLAWLFLTEPAFGRLALSVYLIGTVAAYLGGLAGDLRGRLATFAVAALAGSSVALFARNFTELAIGLGAILAVFRSGVLFRSSTARAAVIEGALVFGGLLFARFVAAPTPRGVFLAIWAFFLVQSFYFLIGGVHVRSSRYRRDPFEEAHSRALALLERGAA